jgi:hypothetical protein
MITETKRARERARAETWMATPTKRERATRVVGNKKGDGNGNKEGNGNQRQHTGNGYGKDDGGNGPWFVCVFLFVWRDHKKYGREQN